ncbi:MAG: hypothetical protein A4S17_03735 [Proteobacteria bacterium HN_bin10]|nr:MAG: hypothetical protein A4S17_03735 [Proteobacteria bacterium HN_bin10]
MTRLVVLLPLVIALALPAQAQLPGVGLPQVPSLGAPELDDVLDTTDAALADLRRLRIRELLRTHRRELEADPAGNPIVRRQIIAVGMSEAAIANARAAGYQIVSTNELGEGGVLVTLRAPAGQSTRRALRRLREADSAAVYDFDHLHIESAAGAIVSGFAQSSAASAGPRIGLIDSGVGASVPIAAQRSFVGAAPIPAMHGTTVAGLLSTAAPGARIYAADIYGGAPTGGASSALARALAWLAAEQTGVINISLVGPRNRVVESVISGLISRGFVIVAAVGNDGPAAAPLFPASYPGVVGVTGVDARHRVLIEAGQGEQVDFAALGVHGRARGTSYAAPIVAARLATLANGQRSIADLAADARDLGADGRDDVYGHGLVEVR